MGPKKRLQQQAENFTGRHIVSRALMPRNDYAFPLVSGILGREQQKDAARIALGALGRLGVDAMAYERLDDIGNGLQVLGRPRILVTARDGEPTGATAKQPPTPEGHLRTFVDVRIDKNEADSV